MLTDLVGLGPMLANCGRHWLKFESVVKVFLILPEIPKWHQTRPRFCKSWCILEQLNQVWSAFVNLVSYVLFIMIWKSPSEDRGTTATKHHCNEAFVSEVRNKTKLMRQHIHIDICINKYTYLESIDIYIYIYIYIYVYTGPNMSL